MSRMVVRWAQVMGLLGLVAVLPTQAQESRQPTASRPFEGHYIFADQSLALLRYELLEKRVKLGHPVLAAKIRGQEITALFVPGPSPAEPSGQVYYTENGRPYLMPLSLGSHQVDLEALRSFAADTMPKLLASMESTAAMLPTSTSQSQALAAYAPRSVPVLPSPQMPFPTAPTTGYLIVPGRLAPRSLVPFSPSVGATYPDLSSLP